MVSPFWLHLGGCGLDIYAKILTRADEEPDDRKALFKPFFLVLADHATYY